MTDKNIPKAIKISIKYAIDNTKNIDSKNKIYDIVANEDPEKIINFG